VSDLEAAFDTLWAMLAPGLPAPEREHRFAPPRRWRFDRAWPDRLVAVELDGGTWTAGRHTRGKGYANDCAKHNHAAGLGWRVFRFTSDMLRDDPAGALEPVAAAIRTAAARDGRLP